MLASSKPWVASLGPLTVLKAPRDLAPLPTTTTASETRRWTVGCCVTGDRLTVSSPGLLRVRPTNHACTLPTVANYFTRPMRQVPSWYVATLGSTGFQTRATVVEGGTLLLASSKPWVASLGPLTVLKAPRDLAPLPTTTTASETRRWTVGCCVTGDRLTVSSPGLLRVRPRSVGAVAMWSLMSRQCPGWDCSSLACCELMWPTRPLPV